MKLGVGLLWAVFASSCGPVKGYPGPELPVSELVRVSAPAADNVRFHVLDMDGRSFSSAIQVLPGKHRLYAFYSIRGIGKNCSMDRLGEESPVLSSTDEERCRERNPTDPTGCRLEWMKKPMELRCDYPHSQYSCSLQTTIPEPGYYQIRVGSSDDILELVGPGGRSQFVCVFDRSWWEREKMR